MANNTSKRSHVCGFVKRLRNTKGGTSFFAVSKQQFVLPEASTFFATISEARLRGQTVLVLYEESSRKHPRITGVIPHPVWRQIKAAEEGLSYDAIDLLVDTFVKVKEGHLS
jgi:hypothetical protein